MEVLRSKKSQRWNKAQNNAKDWSPGKQNIWVSNKEKRKRGPNPLRVHKEGPKSMNRQVSNLMKQRKEKPTPTLKAQEKNWAKIPRDSQELGILGACNKAKLGLRQFKGACQETQGTITNMSLSAIQWCRKGIRRHRNQQLLSKDLLSRGIEEEEPWRKVDGDFSA